MEFSKIEDRERSDTHYLKDGFDDRKSDFPEGFFDVILKGNDGGTIRAHRCILYLACPYFKVHLSFHQFGLQNNDYSDVISLPAISGATLRLIVEYIYKGSVKIKAEETMEMLMAAHFLMMTELVKYCDIFLRNEMNMDNVVDCFRLANTYDLNTLRSRSMERIWKHIYNIEILEKLTYGFKDFSDIKLLFTFHGKEFDANDEHAEWNKWRVFKTLAKDLCDRNSDIKKYVTSCLFKLQSSLHPKQDFRYVLSEIEHRKSGAERCFMEEKPVKEYTLTSVSTYHDVDDKTEGTVDLNSVSTYYDAGDETIVTCDKKKLTKYSLNQTLIRLKSISFPRNLKSLAMFSKGDFSFVFDFDFGTTLGNGILLKEKLSMHVVHWPTQKIKDIDINFVEANKIQFQPPVSCRPRVWIHGNRLHLFAKKIMDEFDSDGSYD